MLPIIKKELTKSQIDQLNRAYQSGGRLVIKPTRKLVEGGFLGTLASKGIPVAISLVSKMFGSGLQVDRQASSNTRNVYVPPVNVYVPPVMVTIHINHFHFLVIGKTQLEWK